MNTHCACHNIPTVLDPPRCPITGHRQPVNGVPPKQTREQPVRTWPGEIAGRARARRFGRKQAVR